MKLKPLVAGALIIVAVVSIFEVQNSLAIPAFARREGAKCQMCHFRLPELNEDGHAYIRRGLREERGGMMSGSEMGRGTTDTSMPSGMDMGKSAKTPATLPATSTDRPLGEPLPLEWQKYLTVMGHHMITAQRHEKTGFRTGEVEAWIGGPIDEHWSGLGVLAFDVEGGGVEVEQAYAQYNTSWSPRFVSVRVGQIRPFAFLFNGAGPDMPLSAPLVMSMPLSDRNPITPKTFLRGAELGAVNLPRWNAYVGVGQPQLEGDVGESHTDIYGSAEYLVGAKGNALSVFGYRGVIPSSATDQVLDFDRVAVFANVYAPRAKGVLGLLWGSDRPAGESALLSKGGFLLGEFLLADRWAGYGRYDYARRELPIGDDETTDGPTFGLSFWAQTQVRLTLETQFLKTADLSREQGAMAEILWAF